MKVEAVNRYGRVVACVEVDEADASLVTGRLWSLHSHGYLLTNQHPSRYLHRALFGLLPGDKRQVDHINRDPLDNRRCNLRICSAGENRQNQLGRKGTSRFRGVSERAGKWRAQHKLHGRCHHIGTFATEIEAAIAAERWRRTHMPFAGPDPALIEIEVAA